MKDAEGRRFDNFSSLSFHWTKSDKSLASFASGQPSLVTEMDTDGDLPQIISYRTLEMTGAAGGLDVTVQVDSYNAKYFTLAGLVTDLFKLRTELSDTRTLSLVDDAHIRPASVSLYTRNAHTTSVAVEEGSGYFHVPTASLQQYATVTYDKARSISLLPSVEGEFRLLACDLCLVPRAPAYAQVFVSDVHQIKLNVLDKVQIEHEITAEVQVLDRRGKPIPAQYYANMGLKPKTGHILTLTPEKDKFSPSDLLAKFIVKGVELGRTPLQFIAAQKNGQLIASVAKEIQVFPPLRLEPRNITIIIGATFQVSAYGGPQPQSSVEFEMVRDKIGSISNSGLVAGLQLGSSSIIGRAVGVNADNTRVVYSQDEVTVNVVELQGIKIFAPLKRLQTNTQMPLYAMGRAENETPFTFGSAIPALQFQWSISNSDVANLQPLFYKSGIIPPADNDFAKRILAEEPGHVTVRLTVTPATDSRWQIAGNRKLVDTVQIQVFDALRVTSPDVCDGTLLLTPDTSTKIRTNRDGSSAKLTYTVQHNGGKAAVSVDRYGTLVTGSDVGTASLLVTAHEEHGVNQSVAIAVKVRPVSYLMINSDTVLHTSHVLDKVPLGATLALTVSFHDAVGDKFYATNSKIGYRLNRFDLLQLDHGAENDTLIAKATNIGHTIIQVWDRSQPGLVDYVGIDVGPAITPADADVTLGDVVCLSSALLTDSGYAGSWSNEGGLGHMDAAAGIFTAANVGTTVLSYNVSANLATHTKLTVRPITGIALEASDDEYISNVHTQFPDVFYPIQLTDASNGVITSHIHGPNCSSLLADRKYRMTSLPVRCEATLSHKSPHVLVHQIVSVVTEFDVKNGMYRCRLTPVDAPASLVSELDTTLVISASVSQSDGQSHLKAKPITLPYYPQFHVLTSQLLLTNEMHVVKLRIAGTQKVLGGLKINVLDESLVSIDSPEKDHHGSVVSYPIRLHLSAGLWDRSQLETSIEIRCALTGHVENVPITVHLVGSKEAQQKLVMTWRDVLVGVQKTDLYQLLFLLLAILATVACLVIAYHVMFGARYTAASQQSGAFIPPGTPQQQLNLSGAMSPYNQTLLNQSGSPPRLWSVDYGPYDNSALFKRSPMQSPVRS